MQATQNGMPPFPEHPVLTNAGMCSWENLYEVVEHEFDEYNNKNLNPYVNRKKLLNLIDASVGVRLENFGLQDAVYDLIDEFKRSRKELRKAEEGEEGEEGEEEEELLEKKEEVAPPAAKAQSKARTAYRIFMDTHRDGVAGATKREVNAKLKKMWAEVPAEEKVRCKRLEAEERAKYDQKEPAKAAKAAKVAKKRKREEEGSPAPPAAPAAPAAPMLPVARAVPMPVARAVPMPAAQMGAPMPPAAQMLLAQAASAVALKMMNAELLRRQRMLQQQPMMMQLAPRGGGIWW